MHELFFENLTPANATAPSAVHNFFVKYFGSFVKFVAEVENAGSTRGVVTWVEEHHLGMLVNVEPLLLIDCWEYAFVLDYKTTGRGPHVKAILKHIDWDVVAHRVEAAVAGRSVMRAVKHQMLHIYVAIKLDNS
ncbi:Iron/manganese Superoxide dismutase [Monocercomonoides exilis]|uniref:Iron/manganese Superoxide dismutase n=1 Tax=Monocercomonoides exilis TaxID=2049356 RepID=UPI0035593F86|nr:Iron/manganese Superoxide dismutase [Monocercomonoides exilis]